ncbi:hypothetical protein E2562_018962 [Oryza meyeriana var. granulata]|uniref:Uncharacterized protein n=1 Tax=Oryza meyeriana var. granulata TaxID=110450 RepID=A0A6G1DKR5_9ORYZ|nr:hypothetical protein E2562_018962 [Oryza meyeriana var. granulata]
MDFNTTPPGVCFTSMSLTHGKSQHWGAAEGGNCYNETADTGAPTSSTATAPPNVSLAFLNVAQPSTGSSGRRRRRRRGRGSSRRAWEPSRVRPLPRAWSRAEPSLSNRWIGTCHASTIRYGTAPNKIFPNLPLSLLSAHRFAPPCSTFATAPALCHHAAPPTIECHPRSATAPRHRPPPGPKKKKVHFLIFFFSNE